MRANINRMTNTLEERMRKIIDQGSHIEGLETALRELDANVTNSRSVVVNKPLVRDNVPRKFLVCLKTFCFIGV